MSILLSIDYLVGINVMKKIIKFINIIFLIGPYRVRLSVKLVYPFTKPINSRWLTKLTLCTLIQQFKPLQKYSLENTNW